MKLLTEEIRRTLPPLDSTDGLAPSDIPVIVKFFNPAGPGAWYVTEGDGNDLFFGLANIFEPELGYFSLSELQTLRVGPGGVLGIERDLYLGQISLLEAMRREGMKLSPIRQST